MTILCYLIPLFYHLPVFTHLQTILPTTHNLQTTKSSHHTLNYTSTIPPGYLNMYNPCLHNYSGIMSGFMDGRDLFNVTLGSTSTTGYDLELAERSLTMIHGHSNTTDITNNTRIGTAINQALETLRQLTTT